MKTILYPEKSSWPALLQRPALDTSSLEKTVGQVLNAVKRGGDEAVKDYTARFDGVRVDLPVSKEELLQAKRLVSKPLKAAIGQAYKNIFKFHASQIAKEKPVAIATGVKCWRKAVPIEKVGLYIPGGSAPLFSTILMLGIPAKIAGCKEIVLCTPPASGGSIHPAILYAAQLVGIKKIFKVGGIQAIGAMAYGTQSVPKVYKIFGPGNQYVTCAKQLVNKEGIAIDMPAGPSEVAVWADAGSVPAFVAADLLAQAEHGPDSQAILVSTSEKVINHVQRELGIQLNDLPRKDIAQKALQNSKAILVRTSKEALDLLNEYAPEHLIICCKDARQLAEKVVNAGSVFIGNYSPESAGDYASGTNHTLPTNGYARSYSGVSLDSFVKKITFQELSRKGIESIGPAVEVMAEAEGLNGHRNAVTIRLKYNGKV